MFHDVLLAQHGYAAYFAMILANRQAKAGIVEHGTMRAIVEWMFEAQVAAATI